MKKQILAALAAVLLSVPASAQFEAGTNYVAASLSGIGLSYSKSTDWKLDINANAGHFVADEWLLHGTVGLSRVQKVSTLQLGAGFRYYIRQNGLSLGAGVGYEHCDDFNTLYLKPEVAYTFFINKYLTIEPSVYYKVSTNQFSDYSSFGVAIGLGYYFKSKSKKQPYLAQ